MRPKDVWSLPDECGSVVDVGYIRGICRLDDGHEGFHKDTASKYGLLWPQPLETTQADRFKTISVDEEEYHRLHLVAAAVRCELIADESQSDVEYETWKQALELLRQTIVYLDALEIARARS